MKKQATFLLGFLLIAATAQAQDTWESFKTQSTGYYHTISMPDIDNFSCLISANFYLDFLEGKADSSFHFPLKIVWIKNRGNYYLLNSLPQFEDSLRTEALTQIQFMKNFFDSALLFDWLRFSINSPLEAVPPAAGISFAGDTVGVQFSYEEEGTVTLEKRTFTRGGQLGRAVWVQGDQKVVTLPYYSEVDGKWLCIGWTSQIYEKAEVVSGMEIAIKFTRQDGKLLPRLFSTRIQSSAAPDRTSANEIYVSNFIFNQKLEIVESPERQDTPETPAGDK